MGAFTDAVNSWMGTKFPFKYRSAAFILVFGVALVMGLFFVSIWHRYFRQRPGLKRRRHNVVTVAVTPRAAKQPVRVHDLLSGVREALEKELGRTVSLEALYVYDGSLNTPEEALGLSEVCAKCGVAASLAVIGPMSVDSAPRGAWVRTTVDVDVKHLAKAVDAVLAVQGENIPFLSKRHKVWLI
jgi:hypothetical protein